MIGVSPALWSNAKLLAQAAQLDAHGGQPVFHVSVSMQKLLEEVV
jgi:hypothetical protein